MNCQHISICHGTSKIMSRGLSTAEVQTVALNFVASLNYKVPLDFKIRDTWKEIYGFDSLCGGAFHSAEKPGERGFVTVAAKNHRSPDAVQRTIQHEILGHYLLNTYTPAEKREVIGRIMSTQNEPNLAEQWQKVKHHYPDKNLSIQAEELFAAIAERIDIHKRPKSIGDSLLNDSGTVTLDSIESTILHRVKLLKDGLLGQKTYPSTDVHAGPVSGVDLERRLEGWRRDRGIDPTPTKPGPGM